MRKLNRLTTLFMLIMSFLSCNSWFEPTDSDCQEFKTGKFFVEDSKFRDEILREEDIQIERLLDKESLSVCESNYLVEWINPRKYELFLVETTCNGMANFTGRTYSVTIEWTTQNSFYYRVKLLGSKMIPGKGEFTKIEKLELFQD